MLNNIADVLAQMRAWDAALPEGDGLKWFNWLYLRVTEAVAERIAAAGYTNPVWMEKLDVRFAGYYFDAVEAWDRGAPVPGCWRAMLAKRHDVRITRLQFALAGMNAHINHDLCLALVDTFEATGSAPHTGGVQYADYESVNPLLGSLIDAARAELLVRLLGDLLPEVHHLEDTLAAWSVSAAREAAWTNCELLWDVRDVPLISGRYLDVLDGMAALAGKTLLVPVP